MLRVDQLLHPSQAKMNFYFPIICLGNRITPQEMFVICSSTVKLPITHTEQATGRLLTIAGSQVYPNTPSVRSVCCYVKNGNQNGINQKQTLIHRKETGLPPLSTGCQLVSHCRRFLHCCWSCLLTAWGGSASVASTDTDEKYIGVAASRFSLESTPRNHRVHGHYPNGYQFWKRHDNVVSCRPWCHPRCRWWCSCYCCCWKESRREWVWLTKISSKPGYEVSISRQIRTKNLTWRTLL